MCLRQSCIMYDYSVQYTYYMLKNWRMDFLGRCNRIFSSHIACENYNFTILIYLVRESMVESQFRHIHSPNIQTQTI